MTKKVFLSHNSADKPSVEKLAEKLVAAGFRPWLDKWNLVAGDPWQPALEAALKECDVCAVFLGSDLDGPWHNQEMQLAINRRVYDKQFRVVPVLLPTKTPRKRGSYPGFLGNLEWVEFESLDNEYSFKRLVNSLQGLTTRPPKTAIVTGSCPYKGLVTFKIDDADYFFGREALTDRLVADVKRMLTSDNEPRFLAIVGASGSGKSSVARAGLLYELSQGAIPGSDQWLNIIIDHPGAEPLKELFTVGAEKLGLLQNAMSLETEFIKPILENEDYKNKLNDQASCALANQGDKRLLLFIDQFEEIFTACHDLIQRNRFVDTLLHAARAPYGKIMIVITIRLDFLGKCVDHPDLNGIISGGGTEFVGAMSDNELEAAIVKPADRAGVEISASLVQTLIQDVRKQPGSLPLLQHVLQELWQNKTGAKIADMDFISGVKGIEGALSNHADKILNEKYPTQNLRDQVLNLLTRLVHISDTATPETDTRNRHPIKDAEYNLLKPFIDAHLLITSADGEDEEKNSVLAQRTAIVEVAHEALIRHWPTLQEALKSKRELRIWQQTVNSQFQKWLQLNKAGAAIEEQEKYYLQSSYLTEGVKWLDDPVALDSDEHEFIRLSKRFDETQELRIWHKKIKQKYDAWQQINWSEATYEEKEQCFLKHDLLDDGLKWLQEFPMEIDHQVIQFIEKSRDFYGFSNWWQKVNPTYHRWQNKYYPNSRTHKKLLESLCKLYSYLFLLDGYESGAGAVWLKHPIEHLNHQQKLFISLSLKKLRLKVRSGIALITLLLIFLPINYWLSTMNASWVLATRAASVRWFNSSTVDLFVPNMIEIPPKDQQTGLSPVATFQMGTYSDEKNNKTVQTNETPQHTVTFAKPYYIAETELPFIAYQVFYNDIQKQYFSCEQSPETLKVEKPDDEGWGYEYRPVINVSWYEASCYTKWLSLITGKKFHLPTESQWEYAARAGNTGDFFWGDKDAKSYAWFSENSDRKTLPENDQRIKPNPFGLYHMSGNVWEWVQDCYAEDYKQAQGDGSAWESKNCSGRVLRGGSWNSLQDYLRSADRGRLKPNDRGYDIGFRLAQD